MSDKRPGPLSVFLAVGSSAAVAWSVAAILAFASLWIGQLYVLSRAENRLLHDQQQFTELELRDVSQHAEAERLLARRELIDASAQIERLTNRVAIARREDTPAGGHVGTAQANTPGQPSIEEYQITLLPPDNGGFPAVRAFARWNPETQEGTLRTEGLPPASPNHAYRLWLTDPALPAPIDCGAIAVDPVTGAAQISFHPEQQVTGRVKLVVSLEPSHGASKPSGPVVLSGE